MKQREFQNCIGCDRGVVHSGDITFVRIRFDRMLVNLAAVRRQHGLETSFGPKAAPLASVMGPDEDLARSFSSGEALLCQQCAIDPKLPPVAFLLERAEQRRDDSADGESSSRAGSADA